MSKITCCSLTFVRHEYKVCLTIQCYSTFTDIIYFQWFRLSACTIVTLSPPGLPSPTLSTLIVSCAFLHLSHQQSPATIQLHHDIASQQHCPTLPYLNQHPTRYLEPIQTHQPSLSQHRSLYHKQPTHHTHLQPSPLHQHNWHMHCWPFNSKVSSTRNYLIIPPCTIPASHSNFSAQSSSHLTSVLPHIWLSKISSTLGNERPGLVLKVPFCPPSI